MMATLPQGKQPPVPKPRNSLPDPTYIPLQLHTLAFTRNHHHTVRNWVKYAYTKNQVTARHKFIFITHDLTDLDAIFTSVPTYFAATHHCQSVQTNLLKLLK